ncbi:MAG: sigma-70 family RNA polymerase sigma factor, partial [Kofleriaceae bacterium]
ARPDVAVTPAQLARYLASHADDDRPPSQWLAERDLGDVRLACAITHGDPIAQAAFERELVPALVIAANRVIRDEELARDVAAAARTKLVIGDDAGPRIAGYGGHGPLALWARVIVVRAAVDELRRRQREVPADDALWDAAAPGADPALATQKRESAAHVKGAFHTALARLTPRQRNLLRHHLLDGLTIDELGPMYRVHRVTAARWLSAARADLWAETRRELRTTLALDDTAIRALLDEIRSTLDLSIERALGS